MSTVQITVSCKRTQLCLRDTGIVERLQKRKYLQSVLIRHCMDRGLRFFIREEIGNTQHVAWLGTEEILDWTNSITESHLHWKKGKTNERKIPKNKESSRIHYTTRKATSSFRRGTRKPGS